MKLIKKKKKIIKNIIILNDEALYLSKIIELL